LNRKPSLKPFYEKFETKENPYFINVCVPVSYEGNAWINAECPFDPCETGTFFNLKGSAF